MADLVGQQFGNYKLIRKLGSGGFADVYLGEHIHLGSEAAIKVMRDQLSDADKELFRTEGRNLVRLIHPNIVRLLDFGIENDIPYLLMDYVPNGSLHIKYPKGTILPITAIITYVKQVAGALQYAHDQKLIHRDVKPENMLLGRNNEIVLSDFGIAVVSHSTKSMRIENITGTAYYMAPEQLGGNPRPASDQYSLGVIVYLWLTGVLPFTGTYVEIVSQQLTKPPPSLRNTVPNLPVEVEYVVLKALEKDSQQRYESIQAFGQALEQASQRWVRPTMQVNISPQNEHKPTIDVPYSKPSPGSIIQEPTEPSVLSQLQKTKEQWFDEGVKFYDRKQFREAIAVYDNAIKLDPKYADAYNNRGLAYAELKEYRRAIWDYSRAIELRSDADAYNNRGLASVELKEYKGAIEDYNQAIALDPQYAFAYNNRGDAYAELKEYRRALMDYNRAIALDPQYTLAYHNRGLTYHDLQRYQRAIEDYDQAIALDPQDAVAYTNRGNAYAELKQHQMAIEDYNQAIVIDPRDADVYYNRGNANYDLKEYRRAIKDYNHALTIDPNHPDAKKNRAKARRLLNRK